MPSLERLNLDIQKQDAYIFFVFENSRNISNKTLIAVNYSIAEFLDMFSEIENNTDVRVKVVAMEFEDKCKIISNVGSMLINELSPLEMKPSNKIPNFEYLLCVLNSVIKDYCNRNFTKQSFYAPIFIFVIVGLEDNKYLSALKFFRHQQDL